MFARNSVTALDIFNMEIVIQPTPEAAASVAARLMPGLIRAKPPSVLGLVTGSTPLTLYRKLISLGLDWRPITTFNLDEYVGISPPSYKRQINNME